MCSLLFLYEREGEGGACLSVLLLVCCSTRVLLLCDDVGFSLVWSDLILVFVAPGLVWKSMPWKTRPRLVSRRLQPPLLSCLYNCTYCGTVRNCTALSRCPCGFYRRETHLDLLRAHSLLAS